MSLVRLKYATTQEFSVGGISYAFTYMRVKVRNAGFEKTVGAHYDEGAAVWPDVLLPWLDNYGDYDVFGSSAQFTSDQFAVWADVAGETDWDNNGGMNYHVPNFHSVVGGNVALHQAIARQGTEAGGGFTVQTSWFEGQIYVNNLTFGKRVGVRFTADGGATWQDSDATYIAPVTEGAYSTAGGPGTAEGWRFKTPEYNLNTAAPDFFFAVYFERLDTGDWYWDNNFGQNYTLSKMDGATIG
jgi:hypothetical protein